MNSVPSKKRRLPARCATDRKSSRLVIVCIAAALMAAAMLTLHASPAAASPATASSPPPSAFEEVPRLQTLAAAAAAPHLPALAERQRLLAGPIPPRTRVTICPIAIKPSVGTAPHGNDRVLIELRCESATPWHLYVPVRVVGTSTVTIAARAIVAGSVLTAADLRIERRDMTELPTGYLDDPAVALGRTAARPIAAGSPVSIQQLVASKAVQRGQTVTLVADAGGISVRMAGRALSDALINQRLRVQNLSSGKIVEGIARSEQVVEIIFR